MINQSTRLQPRRAVRFIFEYEGDQLRLVAQQTVEMVVAEATTGGADTPGYYLDSRDAGERTLARVPACAAFSQSAEVFPERHDEPIARIDTPRQRGAFAVTLPAVEHADHVTVVRISPGAERGAGLDRVQPRAIDVASFPLRRP